ncbi:hypothetical protein PTSG_03957 [Salpingoeca rosetta]|uniref:SAYSvFN domain-containing protein n=1 Tax=Salpingoeca rosetta (strain ATCC 50818 / BSB-021) TaxID=946362 RepID=F2U7D2_SALR5|nr:uncharacterized protein PTSG_03957 [Salpingoeca rosetta]EGD83349.1 hypothetical protein PTSG_03957 [Salpingoeca rosetta]|eukprot:XP_004994853.1 hypothetical protein PTSG_03957 [Salpingoeca rosetta]
MSSVRKRLQAFRQQQQQQQQQREEAVKATGSAGGLGLSKEEKVVPEDVLFAQRDGGSSKKAGSAADSAAKENKGASEEERERVIQVRHLTWLDIGLRLAAYALLQYVFWVLGFGLAFFLVAAFYFLYASTRSGPRRKGEKSAYALFNENNERIHGDIDPETMVRQYGAAGML